MHTTTEFTINQHQLGDYFHTEQVIVSKESVQMDYDEWIKENYGDIPEELAKQLIEHNFEVTLC